MSTSLNQALNKLNESVVRIEKGNQRVVVVAQQVIISLFVALLCSLVWFSVSILSSDDSHVAGKYGSVCYESVPEHVTKPVHFDTLADCLDFVGK